MTSIEEMLIKLEAIQNHIALKEHEFELQRKMWKAQKISQNVYIAEQMNEVHNLKAQIRAMQEHDKILEG
jgi:hypothetical protein